MGKGAWFRKTIVSGAVVLAAAMLVSVEAGAITFDHRIGDARQVIAADIAGSKTERLAEESGRPDPNDDGSIIIECVAFGSQRTLTSSLAALPQVPLGPSTCRPREYERAFSPE